ncbi:MAG TPA: hypothetical protein VHU62_07275 [Mycobacterium sp.]|jgi:hypothetical protein|nr:hypothetical protein [Mycobacterium sp.]
MLVHKQAATSADAMQAGYFRGRFEEERSGVAAQLASLTRRLTECMTTDEMTTISHVRRAIRVAEGELRVIDRMLDAIEARFPEEGVIRRHA